MKQSVFDEFVRWTALPFFEKNSLGLKDQNEFAKHYGVNKDTLTRWKNRPEFEKEVDHLQRQWGRDKTPTVVDAIYRSAVKGNARSQSLWMQTFTRFKPGKTTPLEPLLHPDDIRNLINTLPPDLQEKYNSFLRDLLTDATAHMEERFDDMSNSPNYDGL